MDNVSAKMVSSHRAMCALTPMNAEREIIFAENVPFASTHQDHFDVNALSKYLISFLIEKIFFHIKSGKIPFFVIFC